MAIVSLMGGKLFFRHLLCLISIYCIDGNIGIGKSKLCLSNYRISYSNLFAFLQFLGSSKEVWR